MSVMLPFFPPTSISHELLASPQPGTIASVVRVALDEWKFFGHKLMLGGQGASARTHRRRHRVLSASGPLLESRTRHRRPRWSYQR